MARILVLDSGPLHLLTTRAGSDPGADRCRRWLADRLEAGDTVAVPGAADYEVRRELVRRRATTRLAVLDDLVARTGYLATDRDVLDYAATLWAWVRSKGVPTASPEALDADCIIAASAELAAGPGDSAIVVSGNVKHLARICDARPWDSIT